MKVLNMGTILLAAFIALLEINAISANPRPIFNLGGGEGGGGLLGIISDILGGFGGDESGYGGFGLGLGGGYPFYTFPYGGFGSGGGFGGFGGGSGFPSGGFGYGGQGISSGSYSGSDATNVNGVGNAVKKRVEINV